MICRPVFITRLYVIFLAIAGSPIRNLAPLHRERLGVSPHPFAKVGALRAASPHGDGLVSRHRGTWRRNHRGWGTSGRHMGIS